MGDDASQAPVQAVLDCEEPAEAGEDRQPAAKVQTQAVAVALETQAAPKDRSSAVYMGFLAEEACLGMAFEPPEHTKAFGWQPGCSCRGADAS